MDDPNSNITPYSHISLPYIMGYAINANHQRSQCTPLHCTTYLHVLNWINILRNLVIIVVLGFW